MGDIQFNDNTINSHDYGIYVDYFEYFGEDLYDKSSWLMGDIQFKGNTINSNDHGMYIRYIYNFGDYMEGNSTLTMGNIEISENIINSTLNGIYFYRIYDIADGMYDYSSFTMGAFSVDENVITSGDDGIHIDYLESFGITVYDNSSFVMGDIEFEGNLISNCEAGLNFTDSENTVIRNNIIQNCSYGIYLLNSTNNLIYHNNFLNNTVQAYVTFNYTNTWDNDYPSGGNYWTDYTDIDQYSGSGQNITGSDRIWDHPYVINTYNEDRYPFAGNWAWDVEPPSISDVSQDPEIPNDLETVTITVIVTDTESGVHNVTLSYSTDGGETWNNVTMQKTTEDTYQGEIPGLPVETHVQYKITAYDNAGNPAIEDNAGSYYNYTVIPEFPAAIILPLFMLFALIGAAVAKFRCKITAKNT
jgi:parallel beta-helix repeat protein